MTVVCFALAITGATIASTPAPAYAASGGASPTANKCKEYPGLINRFGSCIKHVILETGKEYFKNIYTYFERALAIFLTIGVIIYGVMLSAGMVENVKRDSMIVLLKIVFVIWFASHLQDIFDWVVQAMDGLIELFFQFSNSMDEGKCAQITGSEKVFVPFARLDCLMDLVIGIKTSDYDGSYSQKVGGDGVERGLINFFFKSGISTSLGLLIGAVGFAMIYSLVFTIIRVVFMYLIALIGLTFVIMLGPIFIPLVMFKVTKNYFEKWINLIVSFGLQPVIMFAYVAVMIIAFDKAIFSGSNSLMSAIVGPSAASTSEFKLNQWLEDNDVIARNGVVELENKADDAMKDTSNLKSGDTSSATTAGIRKEKADEDNVQTYVQGLPINQIDWKKLADARGMEEKELMKQITYALIFVSLVIFVFINMLQHIPNVATDVTGGIYDSPNLWQVVGNNPLAAAGGNLGSALQGGLNRLLGGKPG